MLTKGHRLGRVGEREGRWGGDSGNSMTMLQCLSPGSFRVSPVTDHQMGLSEKTAADNRESEWCQVQISDLAQPEAKNMRHNQ